MPRTLPRTVSALVLALAVGGGPMTPCHATTPVLPTSQLATIQAQKQVRIEQATTLLHQLRGELGLDSRTEFTPHQTLINPQGRTVVHFHQSYGGHRVWAGEAIAHVEADGEIKALTQGVKTGIALDTVAPRLSPDQARDIALRNLAPKGQLRAAPKVEQVVFPTGFTGGLSLCPNGARGGQTIDREMSIWAKAPAAAYIHAYEVKTLLSNIQDGHREIHFIIDGNTGAILRKWSALQEADSPAQGAGTSYYRGAVPLATAQAADGTFALHSVERGSLPTPYIYAQDPTLAPGLAMYYGVIDTATGGLGFMPFVGHATNTWGDGTILPMPWDAHLGKALLDTSTDGTMSWLQGALTPTGETAAVDAHFGLSMTWDFYKNVFQRDGVDNLGTSTFAIVHLADPSGLLLDNAFWDPTLFGMVFGEGAYPAFPSGGIFTNMTELDITGHEMTHGVTQTSVGTAGLIYAGESGGLNEATSDMLGKMVQAYASGGATGTAIPDFPAGDHTPWLVGHNSLRPPLAGLRAMYKPSLDGASADGWYDGINLLDVHMSSGPPNRFFYFLCSGASSDPASSTFSPYLPGGMTGIGNDRAARIWYKTLTEHLVSDATFEVARAGAITSAQELFGVGSPEETAVAQAWAAVNVGAALGQPDPVRVTFPVFNPAGGWLDTYAAPPHIFSKIQIFPTDVTVSARCAVANTSNTTVTWTAPYSALMPNATAGTINPDGTWTTGPENFWVTPLILTATSQADPRQFAKTYVILVHGDADQDKETDALDMGIVAMCWGLPTYSPYPQGSPEGDSQGRATDWSIVFLDEALANAFPAK